MKNLISISILVFVLMFSLFSCKKKDAKPEKEQSYAIKTMVTTVNSKGDTSLVKGIIVGTKEELNVVLDTTNNDGGVQMMVLSAYNNVFHPFDPKQPPTAQEQCDEDIYRQKQLLWYTWQAEADEHCLPVTHMLNCVYPYDAMTGNQPRAYTVYPSFAKCGLRPVLVLHKFLAVPDDPGAGFYDSKEVHEFIEKL